MTDKVKENFVRRRAKRIGYFLQKSHGLKWRIDNQLKYRLLKDGRVEYGEKYDLSLDEIEQLLGELEKQIIK